MQRDLHHQHSAPAGWPPPPGAAVAGQADNGSAGRWPSPRHWRRFHGPPKTTHTPDPPGHRGQSELRFGGRGQQSTRLTDRCAGLETVAGAVRPRQQRSRRGLGLHGQLDSAAGLPGAGGENATSGPAQPASGSDQRLQKAAPPPRAPAPWKESCAQSHRPYRGSSPHPSPPQPPAPCSRQPR